MASTLVSLGCLQSALELFERLEMWEEMAECLQAVGRSGKAEEVLRQQIALNETPALWCLLGDVTKVTLLLYIFMSHTMSYRSFFYPLLPSSLPPCFALSLSP